ncbi:FG-GAP-like repeat-containing protein [Parasediminibacterium sp. JCM 36343]|uniref:FG-GAP-like repeat-containing protein n=1 Tax=Parasediminibacterium sp. JCM 36343 TaxID=3374279 RepID=UPI0039796632
MKQYFKYNKQFHQQKPLPFFGTLLLLLIAMASKAQPIITAFAPASGAVGTAVTITGSNFNTDTASNIVFFGATRASVTNASVTSLVAVIPAGATYQPISVVNTATNLIGSSAIPFSVTFNSGIGQALTAASFSAKADFATGSNPAGIVAIADIDGDGNADMVVLNRATNTFAILKNTSTVGKTAFAAKVDFATDSTPSAIAIGDLDGDGKQDIVITSLFANKIAVYKNTATKGVINASSLGAKVNFISDTLSMPTGVAIGDLDGDGKPDIAVANSYSNTVSVLRNIAKTGIIDSSSFAPAVDFTTGLGPSSVAIADLNGDNKLDLIVSNLNAKTISVFKNTTTGDSITTASFAKKIDFSVGTCPYTLATGDLNGDGKLDIVVANQTTNTISILTNKVNAGKIDSAAFAAKFDLPSYGSSPYSVSVGNIDSDTLPDIVVANLVSNNIAVIKNVYTAGILSAASFAKGVPIATGNYPFSAAIADIDGDGQADLAVPNYGKNVVSVYHNMLSNILPISFLNFTGQYQSPGNALLKWETGIEINTAYYIVLRSIDGVAFNEVGRAKVQGAGYQYSYTDALPLANKAAVVYYRIEGVDNDGKKTYSNTVAINADKKLAFAIFPNPAKYVINIQISSTSSIDGLVLITDFAGHAVYTGKLLQTSPQQIPVASFAKGAYSVTIFTPSGKQTKQVVIK